MNPPRKRNAAPIGVYRTGGAYQLKKAFVLLDISPSLGYELIRAGRINVIRLGVRSPRITDAEISRLLGENIAKDDLP